MLKNLVKFLKDEEGASAVEYGLIVGLVAVAAVAVLLTMGGNLSSLFETVSTKLSGASSSSSSSSTR